MKGESHPDYRTLTFSDCELLYWNGQIRHLKVGGIQVVNAIYATVRDRDWGTVPYKVVNETLGERMDGFSISMVLEFREHDIVFNAEINIKAANGEFIFSMDGSAMSNFQRNRIGLSVLFPIGECKGLPVEVLHTDGTSSKGVFPESISPHQPFQNIRSLRWEPSTSLHAELLFDGDIFEMEDQRNWTDASYKIYGTPLSEPFPVHIGKGSRISQTVTLTLSGNTGYELPDQECHTLQIDPSIKESIPGMGTGRSSEDALSPEEAELLKRAGFNHYRVELWLGGSRWQKILKHASHEQKMLGWPLELVLHFTENSHRELKTFLDQFYQQPVPLKHILLFDHEHLSGKALLGEVVPGLRQAFPFVPIGGGTDANFAELNRNHPKAEQLDFIAYTICPQVHASDDLSLLENLEAQSETVFTAKELFGLPVSIPAITLSQRFNAVASSNDKRKHEAPPPLSPDRRQGTPFAAGWTVGSLKQLIFSGAESLTYFETTGARGILNKKKSNDMLSPLFHIFREVLAQGYSHVVSATSSAPLLFDGLMLTGRSPDKLIIINHTTEEQQISISGIKGEIFQAFQLIEAAWSEQRIEALDLQQFTLKSLAIYKFFINSTG
ncbi:MAG: hypothetical protein ABFS38_08460 [Bacteroidota bacterium]